MVFLITRPDHEDIVFYASEWSKEIIEKAKEKGIKVLDCYGQKATKKTIEDMIAKTEPNLIMFNGHGGPNFICGYKDEILVEKDKNEEILENKIVYARTCSSAKELGESCIKKGTKTYIGYKENFLFWINNFKSTTPLADELAEPFFMASNQIIHSLLNGRTAIESHKRSQTVFDEQIERFQRSDAPPDAQYILPLLFWDKINQLILGDENANL